MTDSFKNQGGGNFLVDEIKDLVGDNTKPHIHPQFFDQKPDFRNTHNKSAPARLTHETFNESTIFSYTTKFADLFQATDIRTHDNYSDFYNSHKDSHKLPEPIEGNKLWFDQEKYRKNSPSGSNIDYIESNRPKPQFRGNFANYSTSPRYVDTSNSRVNNQYYSGKTHISNIRTNMRQTGNTGNPQQGRSQVLTRISPKNMGGVAPPNNFMGGQSSSPDMTTNFHSRNTPPRHSPTSRFFSHSPLSPTSVSPSSPICTSPTLQALLAANATPLDAGTDHAYLTKYDRERIIQERISKFYQLKDLKGKVYHLAKDQYGCRFLQNRLDETGGPSDPLFLSIYRGVLKHFVKLMSDPFGNYLCQKLLEKCNDHQRGELIRTCCNSLVDISSNIHGTRAVQKLISSTKKPEHILLVINALRKFVVHLIKDLYGNHVIQKCLRVFSTKDKQFVYDAIVNECSDVATHKHGCCVIQRCFDYASEEQKEQLIDEIASHALDFIQDPFANYVVQYVLNLNLGDWNEVIIMSFLGSLIKLSTNKFSSNVIEKCLKIAPSKVRDKMIEEITNSQFMPDLLQDKFGNYVIQTAINSSNRDQHQKFKDKIEPLLHLIKNTKYIRNIESKLYPKRSSTSASSLLLKPHHHRQRHHHQPQQQLSQHQQYHQHHPVQQQQQQQQGSNGVYGGDDFEVSQGEMNQNGHIRGHVPPPQQQNYGNSDISYSSAPSRFQIPPRPQQGEEMNQQMNSNGDMGEGSVGNIPRPSFSSGGGNSDNMDSDNSRKGRYDNGNGEDSQYMRYRSGGGGYTSQESGSQQPPSRFNNYGGSGRYRRGRKPGGGQRRRGNYHGGGNYQRFGGGGGGGGGGGYGDREGSGGNIRYGGGGRRRGGGGRRPWSGRQTY